MLDRSRNFGEVFGEADHKYVQDGKKFDHEGKELGAPAEKPAKATSKSKGETLDQVGAQLSG
jgi:hypothetical protein